MIQRVQTIYLFLAVVALVLFNFVSLGIDTTPEPDVVVFAHSMLPLLIGSAVVALVTLINIFLYGNRPLQMRICRLSLMLTFALIGLTAYYLFGNPETRIDMPGIGQAMLLFVLVFNFIALKKIGSDEKLVRSMDRLR